MSEVQLPPDEEIGFICLADVPRRKKRTFTSVSAMAMEIAADWDLLAVSGDVEEPEDDSPCELCGHAYGQKHRIIPGRWGGTYHPSNVIHLCPNHHAMIHLRLKYHQDPDSLSSGEWNRLDDAMEDPGVNQLWASRAKVVSIQRSIDIGRYHKD
jgi:hypothetical protein